MAWGNNPMAVRWQRLYRGTAAEIAVEPAIAELGVPYRNQFPLYLYGARYFLDFLLPTLGVVIEVDDPSHNRGDKKLADAERTAEIEHKFGWRVVRITNDEALTNPRGSIRAALGSIGLYPLPLRLPTLRDALPTSGQAPQSAVRDAKAQARRASRSTPRKRQSSSN